MFKNNPFEAYPPRCITTMNIVVPVGRDTLYVVRDLEVCDEGTAEDKLRKCGR
jgi:hypothetical protein